MDNIHNVLEYTEFGVTSIIKNYVLVGSKLKGMKKGKPFVNQGKIFINIDESLYEVNEIEFRDLNNEKITRSEVKLDTATRIAAAIINSNNEVLLLKRIKETGEFYCYPGGHQREEESETDCLVREIKEEVGIDITDYSASLICESHEQGFGPEKFFKVDLENKDIEFQDENIGDKTSKLIFMSIDKAKLLKNLYPQEVIHKL